MHRRPSKSLEQRAGRMMEGMGIRALEVPQFLAGDAAKILGTTTGRLQKFVLRYQLTPAKHLGEGQGSRRVFSKEDLYRLAVAARLIGDGFAPKFVASALEEIEDEQLLGMDRENNIRPVGILFRRATKGPQIDFFKSAGPPPVTPETPEYYVLDLDVLKREIDRRIAAVKGSK